MCLNRHQDFNCSLLKLFVGMGLSLMLSLSSVNPSQAIHWSDIPDPRQDNNWVMDRGNILSIESEAKLNQMISALEAKNGIEMVVVTVPEVHPLGDVEELALTLYNTWKIGKKGQNNGVIFLASKKERRAALEKGFGLRAALPDDQVADILQTQIAPPFEQDNFDVGIVKGAQAVIHILAAQNNSLSILQIVVQAVVTIAWIFLGIVILRLLFK